MTELEIHLVFLNIFLYFVSILDDEAFVELVERRLGGEEGRQVRFIKESNFEDIAVPLKNKGNEFVYLVMEDGVVRVEGH